MFRKILASLLCLMMLVAMPLSSLAATDVSLRLIPGEELTAEVPELGTILNALNFRLIFEEGAGLFALESTNGEIASAALRGDEEGDSFYVASAFLGDRVLYFTADDIAKLMEEMMRQQGVDEEVIAQFQQGMSGATNNTAAFGANPEEVLTDPAMLQFMENITNKISVEEGQYTDAAFNPATTKTSISMTGEDILPMLDSQVMKDAYANAAQAAGMTADELLSQVKDLFTQIDMNINVVVYTDEDDLCSMQMDMIMKGDVTLETTVDGKTVTETESIDMTMDMAVNVLDVADDQENINLVANINSAKPEEEKVSLTADIRVNDDADTIAFMGKLVADEETALDFQGIFTEGEDDTVKGWVALLTDGTQITFTVDAAKKAENLYSAMLSLYVRENASSIVEPSWSDKALFSFAVDVNTDAETPELLTKLQSVTSENAVRLGTMDEEQLKAELEGITLDANSALMTALGNLPTELLGLLLGTLSFE